MEQDLIVLNETNHYHQCDAITIVPLESFLKSASRIQLNYEDLYLINSKSVLHFFDKLGFNNTYEYRGSYSEQKIQEMRPRYLTYLRELLPKKAPGNSGLDIIDEQDEERALLTSGQE